MRIRQWEYELKGVTMRASRSDGVSASIELLEFEDLMARAVALRSD